VIWLKNTSGKRDAMLTIAVAFAAAGLARFLLGGVDLAGGRALEPLTTPDVVALLGALAAYVGRRATGKIDEVTP
jgi:hypothetical protein